jgi:hypothetical protein
MDSDVVAISLILLKAIHVESVETRGGIGDPFQIQLLHSENICPDRSTQNKQRRRNIDVEGPSAVHFRLFDEPWQ